MIGDYFNSQQVDLVDEPAAPRLDRARQREFCLNRRVMVHLADVSNRSVGLDVASTPSLPSPTCREA